MYSLWVSQEAFICRLKDILFHPWTLFCPGFPHFLVSLVSLSSDLDYSAFSDSHFLLYLYSCVPYKLEGASRAKVHYTYISSAVSLVLSVVSFQVSAHCWLFLSVFKQLFLCFVQSAIIVRRRHDMLQAIPPLLYYSDI